MTEVFIYEYTLNEQKRIEKMKHVQYIQAILPHEDDVSKDWLSRVAFQQNQFQAACSDSNWIAEYVNERQETH